MVEKKCARDGEQASEWSVGDISWSVQRGVEAIRKQVEFEGCTGLYCVILTDIIHISKQKAIDFYEQAKEMNECFG